MAEKVDHFSESSEPAESDSRVDKINGSVDALFPLLYDELHQLAANFLRTERAGHTLQTTALIHEVWLKLVPHSKESREAPIELSREHFMARAAVVMRHVLVNHAKAKRRLKRGGSETHVAISEIAAQFDDRAVDLVALNEEMEKLAKLDPRQHQIVEMRFFGGMTVDQCAAVLGISSRSAYLDWAHARAWLRSKFEE